MSKKTGGFASMDKAKLREISSRGGKAAHAAGTAHEWTSEEARVVGRRGGATSRRKRLAAEAVEVTSIDEAPDGAQI